VHVLPCAVHAAAEILTCPVLITNLVSAANLTLLATSVRQPEALSCQ
jgi:hypothetical protein